MAAKAGAEEPALAAIGLAIGKDRLSANAPRQSLVPILKNRTPGRNPGHPAVLEEAGRLL